MTDPWGYKPTEKWVHGHTTSNCQDHINTGRWPGHDWAGDGVTRGYPQRAIWHGKVIMSGWDTNGFGYRVVVQHDNGLQSWYAHLINNIPVKVGDHVKCGDIIGYTDNTGNSYGSHIHLGLKQKNTHISKGWLCPLPHLFSGIAAGEYMEAPEEYKYVDLSILQQVPILGIDLSQYQPDFDFARAKSKCPNLKFVIARASIGGKADTSFLRHYQKAKELDLMVGAYHYLKPTNLPDQLLTFINAVRHVELDFPLVVDFEKDDASSDPNINRLNLRGMAEGIVANDDKVKYSAAYYVWKQLNYQYMMDNYSSKGWNRENDHGKKNWMMLYTNEDTAKRIGPGTENWELLPLWTAAWALPPSTYLEWKQYSTWHCHQFGHGKPVDFGTTIDMNQWNPAVPFPTHDEPPPPTFSAFGGGFSVDESMQYNATFTLGGKKYRVSGKMEEVS